MLKQFFGIVVAVFTILPGVHWLWDALEWQSPSKVWAMTVTVVIFTGYLILKICGFRHKVLKDRIEKCADAKRNLEEQLLRKRRSSAEG